MASVDHLNMEAEIMTVREHLEMIYYQFLATYLQPSRHSYPIVTTDPGLRNMRKTLLRCYHAQVENHKGEDGTVADATATRSEIHSVGVVKFIEAKSANRVRGTHAPPASIEIRIEPNF